MLQSTTRLTTLVQTFFGSPEKGQGVLNVQKFQKIFAKCPFFLTLQVCGLEFQVSTRPDSKKNVSCDCFQIVGNLPGKKLMSLLMHRDIISCRTY